MNTYMIRPIPLKKRSVKTSTPSAGEKTAADFGLASNVASNVVSGFGGLMGMS